MKKLTDEMEEEEQEEEGKGEVASEIRLVYKD